MTDKRLIDATEVERVFNQWLGEADSLAEQEAIECCIAHIHDTPAVDPKSLRGHARWVKDENVKIITVDAYGNTFESPVVRCENCDAALSEADFKAAVLEDCSRNAFKGCSRKLQDEHLDGINNLLDSKFTRDDIELIYTYLGNGIQHDLCLRFVASGYDLEVLREYDKKQEAGSNGKT